MLSARTVFEENFDNDEAFRLWAAPAFMRPRRLGCGELQATLTTSGATGRSLKLAVTACIRATAACCTPPPL
jgi:hypothetical protein